MKKRSIALVLALVLLVGGVIGGTVAWLTDTTNTVTNTFTVGDINIELKEHELGDDGKVLAGTTNEVTEENEYKILPGTSQEKDPFVRVKANTEKCYLFLQVKEVGNSTGNTAANGVATEYITYSVDTSVWTPLTDTNGNQVEVNGCPVWYKEHNEVNTGEILHNVLTNKTVSYSENLTKTDINKITDDTKPQLIFKAFAVQKEAATTALAAWNEIADSAKLGYVAPTA